MACVLSTLPSNIDPKRKHRLAATWPYPQPGGITRVVSAAATAAAVPSGDVNARGMLLVRTVQPPQEVSSLDAGTLNHHDVSSSH